MRISPTSQIKRYDYDRRVIKVTKFNYTLFEVGDELSEVWKKNSDKYEMAYNLDRGICMSKMTIDGSL